MKDYRYPTLEWSVDGKMAAFECSHVGVAGTTPVFTKRTATGRTDFPYKYVMRMGISICGCSCDPDCYKKSPFDIDWFDNFIEAKGYTLEAVQRVFARKVQELSASLF